MHNNVNHEKWNLWSLLDIDEKELNKVNIAFIPLLIKVNLRGDNWQKDDKLQNPLLFIDHL